MDRENVIRHIREEIENAKFQKTHYAHVSIDVLSDACELLKKQKAVVPYQHDAVWLCGNCEKEVVGWDDDIDGKEYRYPFCRQCGQAVKWE